MRMCVLSDIPLRPLLVVLWDGAKTWVRANKPCKDVLSLHHFNQPCGQRFVNHISNLSICFTKFLTFLGINWHRGYLHFLERKLCM